MIVRLTRILSSHKNLRTDEVEGDCNFLPIIGERFVMTGRPLDPECAFRLIDTTPVKQVWGCGYRKMRFSTENSLYELEILDGGNGPVAA